MLRPVCLLLLLVFSIYSPDLQFHNLLPNCDMPCLFSSLFFFIVWYAFGGRLEKCQITSSLSHLIWVPCSASSFSAVLDLLWLACWLCGQTVQHTELPQYEGRVPPRSPCAGTLPQPCWLGCVFQLFWEQLCFSNPPPPKKGHWDFPRNPHPHLAVWLWRYFNNRECNKQPVFQV